MSWWWDNLVDPQDLYFALRAGRALRRRRRLRRAGLRGDPPARRGERSQPRRVRAARHVDRARVAAERRSPVAARPAARSRRDAGRGRDARSSAISRTARGRRAGSTPTRASISRSTRCRWAAARSRSRCPASRRRRVADGTLIPGEDPMPETNRRWTLAARPHGMVKESDFAFGEAPIPPVARRPGAGARALSLVRSDPARLDRGSPELSAAGADRRGDARGRRSARWSSRSIPSFARAISCRACFGWQDYALIPGAMLGAKLPAGVPPTWSLGVLGITGLTAYFGMLDLGKPKAGETVVVSGAAGATGSVAGQIAKIAGRARRRHRRRPRQVRVAHEGGALRRRDRLQARGRRRAPARALPEGHRRLLRQRRRRDPRRGARADRAARARRAVRQRSPATTRRRRRRARAT